MIYFYMIMQSSSFQVYLSNILLIIFQPVAINFKMPNNNSENLAIPFQRCSIGKMVYLSLLSLTKGLKLSICYYLPVLAYAYKSTD